MHSRTLLILSLIVLYLSLATLQFTLHESTHRSWLESNIDLDKDRSWFALQLNAGPIIYISTFKHLPKTFPLSCLPSVYEGDLIQILYNGQECLYKRSKLSPRTRLALRLRLSVNHTSEKDLQAVPGIGSRLAHQIILGRPWTQLSSLRRLKGVGTKD